MESQLHLNNVPSPPSRGYLLKELIFWCEVQPLERPRKGRDGHIYQPKENQKRLFREVDNYTKQNVVIRKPIIVDYYFYFRKRWKLMFPTAPEIGDEDNLRKAANDALVAKKIIKDDRLILGGYQYKIYDPDESYCICKIYAPIIV